MLKCLVELNILKRESNIIVWSIYSSKCSGIGQDIVEAPGQYLYILLVSCLQLPFSLLLSSQQINSIQYTLPDLTPCQSARQPIGIEIAGRYPLQTRISINRIRLIKIITPETSNSDSRIRINKREKVENIYISRATQEDQNKL